MLRCAHTTLPAMAADGRRKEQQGRRDSRRHHHHNHHHHPTLSLSLSLSLSPLASVWDVQGRTAADLPLGNASTSTSVLFFTHAGPLSWYYRPLSIHPARARPAAATPPLHATSRSRHERDRSRSRTEKKRRRRSQRCSRKGRMERNIRTVKNTPKTFGAIRRIVLAPAMQSGAWKKSASTDLVQVPSISTFS